MRLLHLHGSHFEMGLQHGQQLLELRPLVVEAAEKRVAVLEGRDPFLGRHEHEGAQLQQLPAVLKAHLEVAAVKMEYPHAATSRGNSV